MNERLEENYSKSKYYHSWDFQAVCWCLVLKLAYVGYKEIAEKDEHLDTRNRERERSYIRDVVFPRARTKDRQVVLSGTRFNVIHSCLYPLS